MTQKWGRYNKNHPDIQWPEGEPPVEGWNNKAYEMIQQLLDEERWEEAAWSAKFERDAAKYSHGKQKFLGLLLFANARLPRNKQVQP